MNWKQIIKRARKNKAFNYDDSEKTTSWLQNPVGEKLRSMGYNKPYTSDELGSIIARYDINLEDMGYNFSKMVAHSAVVPAFIDIVETDDEYREAFNYSKICIDKAQEIYDNIQNTKPSQTLIDELKLTVAPTAPS